MVSARGDTKIAVSKLRLRRLLAALLVLLLLALTTHESDNVGRETFVHVQILWQRKTLPGEDRVFRWGRASPDTHRINARRTG